MCVPGEQSLPCSAAACPVGTITAGFPGTPSGRQRGTAAEMRETRGPCFVEFMMRYDNLWQEILSYFLELVFVPL